MAVRAHWRTRIRLVCWLASSISPGCRSRAKSYMNMKMSFANMQPSAFKFPLIFLIGCSAAAALAGLVMMLLLVTTTSAHAERVKDLASVAGVRGNQLVGYGLVVGLDGTGDQT